MDSLEEFEAILTDPRLIHYAYRMNSKENFGTGIFEDFEDDAFPNSNGEGNLNSIAAITCDDGHHWLIASIPIRDAACMEALAKKNGFMLTDSTHAPWELQVTNLFVLEKNPGYIDTDLHQYKAPVKPKPARGR